MEYVRIGTTYYKTVRKPLASGDVVEFLVPWSTECIKQDHGKHFLSSVPRFDGFCLVPNHLEYKREFLARAFVLALLPGSIRISVR